MKIKVEKKLIKVPKRKLILKSENMIVSAIYLKAYRITSGILVASYL